MAFQARRPFPCYVDNPRDGATKNECVLPVKGLTYADDEYRVCAQRCIELAMRKGDLAPHERELVVQITEREISDDSTETRTSEELLGDMLDG